MTKFRPVDQPALITIFPNGAIICCDQGGEQMRHLQDINWLALLLETLQKKGVDVEKVPDIKTMVNGIWTTVRVDGPFPGDKSIKIRFEQ